MTNARSRDRLFYHAGHLSEILEGAGHLRLLRHHDVVLAQYRHNRSSELLKTDLQHSVGGVVTAQTMRPVTYTPHGHVIPHPLQPRIGFTGALFDAAFSGVWLGNGYRAYQPALRRFLKADALSPFGAGGVNAYAYCGNDPVNHEDSSGMTFMTVRPGRS